MLPERRNLLYFMFSGKNAPSQIFQFKCVSKFLEIDSSTPGALLIFVQRVEDGCDIYCEVNEFCTVSNIPKTPNKRFAFLHANLEEDCKRQILKNTREGKVKVLIATFAVGNGVNLPILKTILWGLEPEPSGVIQASGRTARPPFYDEGSVYMVGVFTFSCVRKGFNIKNLTCGEVNPFHNPKYDFSHPLPFKFIPQLDQS